MSDGVDDAERLPLSALNGAVLTWEDADGNEHSVEFADHSDGGDDGSE